MEFRTRVAQVGPWSTSFDGNLRANHYGETRLPFRHHVRSAHRDTCPRNDGFSKYLQLPVELQRHVLSFCDPASLFQLMHASYSTRQEAQKLFWADPTSRYVIDGEWLLTGGHPRHTNHNLDALIHMQYIEVTFHEWSCGFFQNWRERQSYFDEIQSEEKIAVFWRALHHRFPNAIDVVLDEYQSQRPGAPVPEKIVHLAMGSPEGISISVSQLRWCNDKWYSPESRHVWRKRSNDTSPTWDLIETFWNPRRILPPTKKYSGSVGEYMRYKHKHVELGELECARDVHALRVTAAYYLHVAQTPCVCLWPACGLQFNQPEEWMAHYLEATLRRQDHDGAVPPPPCEAIRAAFLHHDMMLAQNRRQRLDELARLQAVWGEQGSLQRSAAAQQFLQQLRDDPSYAGEVAPEESEIWLRYQQTMNVSVVAPTPSENM